MTRSTMLTVKILEAIPPGVFATGVHYQYGAFLRWVAVRGGGIPDWTVYHQAVLWTADEVRRDGDKLFDKDVIRALVPCDDGAFAMYRY